MRVEGLFGMSSKRRLKGDALKEFQIWSKHSGPQVTVLDFQLGPTLSDEQFLGPCIGTGKP